MSTNLITIKNATLKFASSSGGLSTAPDFTCQTISAAVNARPNLQTVPATFCGPQSQVPAVTGWELALSFLQDWGATNSMSQFLFDNDASLQYFLIQPTNIGSGILMPSVQGQCYVVAGSYAGAAGVPLQATATCPVPAKPTMTPAVAATGATSGTPGTYTPSGAITPYNLAALIAAPVTASPSSAWTTGQYVPTLDGNKAHWSGTAWVLGVA